MFYFPVTESSKPNLFFDAGTHFSFASAIQVDYNHLPLLADWIEIHVFAMAAGDVPCNSGITLAVSNVGIPCKMLKVY